MTNSNYTNKCQLVTVLLDLLLSSSQVEHSTTRLCPDRTHGTCSPCEQPMDLCSIAWLCTPGPRAEVTGPAVSTMLPTPLSWSCVSLFDHIPITQSCFPQLSHNLCSSTDNPGFSLFNFSPVLLPGWKPDSICGEPCIFGKFGKFRQLIWNLIWLQYCFGKMSDLIQLNLFSVP